MNNVFLEFAYCKGVWNSTNQEHEPLEEETVKEYIAQNIKYT